MKIILSRKGFDSAAGGIPSPILEDGTMLSLPIPSKHSPIRYADIELHGHELGRLVEDLGAKNATARSGAHHDPDVVASSRPRSRGWRPLFGQADNEQTVLERELVGEGDLFLFFGWFRRAEVKDDRYRFVRGAENLHVLWGWLQIDDSWDLTKRTTVPTWATDHPHLDSTPRNKNTLYVATKKLVLDGQTLDAPGAGVFAKFDERLVLSAPGRSRSIWRLPRWFDPQGKQSHLGYHGDLSRWSTDGAHVVLRSVARGQEFALDADDYPESVGWVRTLIGSDGQSARR